MTNSLIPYSFTPGTKAKAQEVNANFNALANKIDENNSTTIHANTESTVTGKKTFTQPIISTVKQNSTGGNIIISNIGDGDSIDAINTMNTSNKTCGSLRFNNGEGYNEVLLNAANEDGYSTASLCLRNTNGIAYATCPTYTEDYSDTSDKIVTTNYLAEHWANEKATKTSSASKSRPLIPVQNFSNWESWYRIWSDGWIEQGGAIITTYENQAVTITFLKPFSNVSFCIYASQRRGSTSASSFPRINNITENNFSLVGDSNAVNYWSACGY